MSADSEDWEDFFVAQPPHEDPAVESQSPPSPDEESSQPFLETILDNLPAPAKKSPNKAKGGKKGPNAPPIRKSIVRESIEAPGYQRKWEKSSTAWASYNPRELNTRASGPVKPQRPSSAGGAGKSGSEENLLRDESPTRGVNRSANKPQRPSSASMARKSVNEESRGSTPSTVKPQRPSSAGMARKPEGGENVSADRSPTRGTTAPPVRLQRPSSAGMARKSGEESRDATLAIVKRARPVSADMARRYDRKNGLYWYLKQLPSNQQTNK